MIGQQYKNALILLSILLVASTAYVWQEILVGEEKEGASLYFLDVGQGDSSLIDLPGGVQVLIDGGKGDAVLYQLAEILSPADRYIDIVVLTHPQSDHINGLIDVLKRYSVGVFLFNGDEEDIAAHKELERIFKESDVVPLVVGAGDRIVYGEYVISVLWPSKNFAHKNLNERSLVLRFDAPGYSVLYTGDIGAEVEQYLRKQYVDVDILKVAHHGSKYSSSRGFLKKVSPKVSIIEVGKNSYGHPTSEALNRLAIAGSQIFRTDELGLIKIGMSEGVLNVSAKK